MQATYDEITALTDNVCQAHLNAEYGDLARKLCAALARKRPSPLSRGRASSWVGGIVYTLARVNFLFDPSQEHHMSAGELCNAAGVSQATASAKASQIMDLLDIYQFHPDWTLPSQMEDHPMAWMIMVDGMIVDVRGLPLEIQRIAHDLGLIPYVPGEP